MKKGLIQIQGSLGDLTFYELNGKLIVRTKGGGFNTEAIKKNESMAPTREYASEFGVCSRLKRSYQQSLSWFYRNHKDVTLHGRMMSMLLTIKKLDPVSARGKRVVHQGLQTSEGRALFEDFVYTPECRIGEMLHTSLQMDWESLKLQVKTKSPERIFYPKGATHLELQLVVIVFDFEENIHQVQAAEPLRIARGQFPQTLEMGISALPEGKGTPLAFLGLRYYEISGEQAYDYRDKNCVGLELVGVRWD